MSNVWLVSGLQANFPVLLRHLIRIYKVWTDEIAAHGYSTYGTCNLYRAYSYCALPNAYRDDFTGIPLLTKGLHLPFFRWHDAADFIRQVDSRFLANSYSSRPFRNL